MSRRLRLILLVGLTMIVVTYIALNYFIMPNTIQNQNIKHIPIDPRARNPYGDHLAYLANYNNPQILLGYAQEIFAGKVIAEISNNPAKIITASIPHFQYEVEVIFNIKGIARGKIMVDVDSIEGGRLIEGATYLLAARYWDETHPWYYVGSLPVFYTLVTNDSNLSNAEIVEEIMKHPKTYELLNAYPNEILRDIDIAKNRANNSFRSLAEEQKQEIYKKFSELIPSRPVPEILPQEQSPSSSEPTNENEWLLCRDGKDNDNDGLVDKADDDCKPVLREDLPSLCKDEDDNDLDGLRDAADPDCKQYYPTPTPPELPKPDPAPTSTTSSGQ